MRHPVRVDETAHKDTWIRRWIGRWIGRWISCGSAVDRAVDQLWIRLWIRLWIGRWIRRGSGVDQLWISCGSAVDQLWISCGSAVDQLWISCGSAVDQLWISCGSGCGSAVDQLWISCGSAGVQLWIGQWISCGSAVDRAVDQLWISCGSAVDQLWISWGSAGVQADGSGTAAHLMMSLYLFFKPLNGYLCSSVTCSCCRRVCRAILTGMPPPGLPLSRSHFALTSKILTIKSGRAGTAVKSSTGGLSSAQSLAAFLLLSHVANCNAASSALLFSLSTRRHGSRGQLRRGRAMNACS
jgi:hypothetical protein